MAVEVTSSRNARVARTERVCCQIRSTTARVTITATVTAPRASATATNTTPKPASSATNGLRSAATIRTRKAVVGGAERLIVAEAAQPIRGLLLSQSAG